MQRTIIQSIFEELAKEVQARPAQLGSKELHRTQQYQEVEMGACSTPCAKDAIGMDWTPKLVSTRFCSTVLWTGLVQMEHVDRY